MVAAIIKVIEGGKAVLTMVGGFVASLVAFFLALGLYPGRAHPFLGGGTLLFLRSFWFLVDALLFVWQLGALLFTRMFGTLTGVVLHVWFGTDLSRSASSPCFVWRVSFLGYPSLCITMYFSELFGVLLLYRDFMLASGFFTPLVAFFA